MYPIIKNYISKTLVDIVLPDITYINISVTTYK